MIIYHSTNVINLATVNVQYIKQEKLSVGRFLYLGRKGRVRLTRPKDYAYPVGRVYSTVNYPDIEIMVLS